MTIKKNNESWPEYMPVLESKDFEHGEWQSYCGTKRCMVGWVGHVFHDTAYIVDCKKRLSQPCREFLKELARLTDVDPAEYESINSSYLTDEEERLLDYYLMMAVSDAFEGEWRESPMTAEEAAKIWNKVIKKFGYTEVVYV